MVFFRDATLNNYVEIYVLETFSFIFSTQSKINFCCKINVFILFYFGKIWESTFKLCRGKV